MVKKDGIHQIPLSCYAYGIRDVGSWHIFSWLILLGYIGIYKYNWFLLEVFTIKEYIFWWRYWIKHQYLFLWNKSRLWSKGVICTTFSFIFTTVQPHILNIWIMKSHLNYLNHFVCGKVGWGMEVLHVIQFTDTASCGDVLSSCFHRSQHHFHHVRVPKGNDTNP